MVKKVIRGSLAAGSLIIGGASSVLAQTTPTDYGAELTTNLTTINTIWGTVATIMIASALVAVGVRFFRKTK